MTGPRKTRSAGNRDNITFDEPHLVLVEGADDQAVVSGVIAMLGLDGFHVHDMNGKDNWQTRIGTLSKGPDFQTNVRSLGLVRDADDNPDGAWDSCRFSLERAGLPTPTAPVGAAEGNPTTAILILPSRTTQGAIEDLCLASFDANRLDCVNSYFDCLNVEDSGRSSKGLVQVYFGGFPDPVRDITLAVAKRRLNLNHACFDEVRQFVNNLSGGDKGI